MTPSIGRIVHYQAHGSKDGTYPSVCRAAVITDVTSDEVVSVAVFHPDGLLFSQDLPYDDDTRRGGTWHWPERV